MKRQLQVLVAALIACVILGIPVSARAAEPPEVTLQITLYRCCIGRIGHNETIPPFVGRVQLNAIPVNQDGEYLYEEKIHWRIHSTRNVGDELNLWAGSGPFAFVEFADSQVRRTITITASLYYDRSVYDVFRVTFDPRQPTMTAVNADEVYFTQGVAQEAQITVTTQNLPDGIYAASISWLPEGMHVVGWAETRAYVLDMINGGYRLVRSVYGEIEIENGAGSFILISDETLGARRGNHSFALHLEPVWFRANFQVEIMPVLTEIWLYNHRFGRLPGSGYIEIWPRLYCMNGDSDWDQVFFMSMIDWTVTGMAEGDEFTPAEFAQWQYFYIGPSTETRTIEITAAAGPDVYTVITIYVDENFEFVPTDVSLHLRRRLMTGINFIALEDEETTVNLFASIRDDFANRTIQLDYVKITIEGDRDDDTFIVGEDEIIFRPGQDPAVRLITITATAANDPLVYDYVHILIVPNRDYLPVMYIAGIDEHAVTMHANNIPDGLHQIHMSIRYTQGWTNHLYLFLWTDYLLMDWNYNELVEFTDGVGAIILENDGIAITDLDSHLLNFYWEAWIEEFGLTASGVELLILN